MSKGAPPFGWQRKSGRLIENPIEQRVIDQMIRMHKVGMVPEKIEEALWKAGIFGRRGGKIDRRTIWKLLRRNGSYKSAKRARFGWKRSNSGALIKDPREQEMLAFIFDDPSRSNREIADDLNGRSMHRRDGTNWAPSHVRSLREKKARKAKAMPRRIAVKILVALRMIPDSWTKRIVTTSIKANRRVAHGRMSKNGFTCWSEDDWFDTFGMVAITLPNKDLEPLARESIASARTKFGDELAATILKEHDLGDIVTW